MYFLKWLFVFILPVHVYAEVMTVNIYPESDHDAKACIAQMEQLITTAIKDSKPLALEGWSYAKAKGILVNETLAADAIFRTTKTIQDQVVDYINKNEKKVFYGIENNTISSSNGPHFHIFKFFAYLDSLLKTGKSDVKGMSVGVTTKDIQNAGIAGYMAIQMLRTRKFPGFLELYHKSIMSGIESGYYESFIKNPRLQYTTDQWKEIFGEDAIYFADLGEEAKKLIDEKFPSSSFPKEVESKYFLNDQSLVLGNLKITKQTPLETAYKNYIRYGMTYRNYYFVQNLLSIRAADQLSSIDVIMHNNHALGIVPIVNDENVKDPTNPKLKIVLKPVCKN